jgi:hypothetical protein
LLGSNCICRCPRTHATPTWKPAKWSRGRRRMLFFLYMTGIWAGCICM